MPSHTKTANIADFLGHLIDASGKTRAQIASEAGFERPNVLSMMRAGNMPIPLRSAGRLATALGIDPGIFVRRCLAEYQPELLEAIEGSLVVATQNERKLLDVVRRATRNGDPAIATKNQENEFARACRNILLPSR